MYTAPFSYPVSATATQASEEKIRWEIFTITNTQFQKHKLYIYKQVLYGNKVFQTTGTKVYVILSLNTYRKLIDNPEFSQFDDKKQAVKRTKVNTKFEDCYDIIVEKGAVTVNTNCLILSGAYFNRLKATYAQSHPCTFVEVAHTEGFKGQIRFIHEAGLEPLQKRRKLATIEPSPSLPTGGPDAVSMPAEQKDLNRQTYCFFSPAPVILMTVQPTFPADAEERFMEDVSDFNAMPDESWSTGFDFLAADPEQGNREVELLEDEKPFGLISFHY